MNCVDEGLAVAVPSLQPVALREIPADGVLCLTLAHNERLRIEDFLRHHRALGVSHFLIVDDNSTDGTREYLATQPDISLFSPRGTNYAQHKVAWRRELSDTFANGRWLVVPDVDELLVFPHLDRGLSSFTGFLDGRGYEAVFAPMVEMYGCVPLDSSDYVTGKSMLETHCYFDGDGYRLVVQASGRLARFPVPALELFGGVRERLFQLTTGATNNLRARLARWYLAHLSRSIQPSGPWLLWERFMRRMARSTFPQPGIVASKIAILRWRKGLRFSGGPHCISERLRLARTWSALLHFKYLNTCPEIQYKIDRAQHFLGSEIYKQVAHDVDNSLRKIPTYSGTRRYTGPDSLIACGLLRSEHAWDRFESETSLSQAGGLARA